MRRTWAITSAMPRSLRTRWSEADKRLRRSAAPFTDRVRPLWAAVTPAGRTVLALTVICWLLASRFGWLELAVVATMGVLLLFIAALFTLGRTRLSVALAVEPPRVSLGQDVIGSIEVTNQSRSPLLSSILELPMGATSIVFDLPSLRHRGRHQETFVVGTQKRGVIPVGPATSVRGDPVGLFRRDLPWTEVIEIFVHPRVVQLETLGQGLVRDLEGRTSDSVSRSDLAFHALREYEPGDDLRHVHWRSTARHGTVLIRQFLDTRRSHVNVIVDCRSDSYRCDEDYETAVSVAGSVLIRAVLDDYDTTFVSGSQAVTRGTGRGVLDACSRAEPGSDNLVHAAGQANLLAPDTSIAFLITGPGTDLITLQRAATQFPVDVARIAVRIDSEAVPSLRDAGDLALLTVSRLEELPAIMRWGTP